MPLYDYECMVCEETFEQVNKWWCHYVTCPKCGCVARRIFTKLTRVYKPKDQPWGAAHYKESRKKGR